MKIYHEKPVIDNWYYETEHQSTFQVLDVDDRENTLEIQYFDGEIEEISMDEWYEMELYAIAPPKDLTHVFDFEPDLVAELKEEIMHPHLENPLKFIE